MFPFFFFLKEKAENRFFAFPGGRGVVKDRTAMNRLNRWIRHNRELHDRLYSGREGKNDICFSLRQVRLLVEYLGEP